MLPSLALPFCLDIARILASTSKPKTGSYTSLNAILATRLKEATQKLMGPDAPVTSTELLSKLATIPLEAEMTLVKDLTVEVCIFVLDTLKKALHQLASVRSKGDRAAPWLGVRDIQDLGTIIAIVARWGLAARTTPGVLPDDMYDDATETFARQGPASASARSVTSLAEITRVVLGLIEVAGGPSTSTAISNPLNEFVTARMNVYLIGALLNLQHDMVQGRQWAVERLHQLLHDLEPVSALTSLVHLRTGSRKQTIGSIPVWLAEEISSSLSRQLMRPEGVASFLDLILGQRDEEPSLHLLDRVSRILLAVPANIEPNCYFSVVTPHILRILRAAAQNFVLPGGKGTPRGDPLTTAAAYTLSQMIEGRREMSVRHLRPLLHRNLLAIGLTASNPDVIVVQGVELYTDVHTLRLLVALAPPSQLTADFILQPIFSALFSLYCELANDALADPLLRGDAEALLVHFLKVSTADTAQPLLANAIEAVELLRSPWEWRHDGDGRMGLGARRIELDDIQEPDISSTVNLIRAADNDSLSGAVFLDWIDDLRKFHKVPSTQTAKRASSRLHLILQAYDRMGPKVLSQTAQIIDLLRRILQQDEVSLDSGLVVDITNIPVGNKDALDDLRLHDGGIRSVDENDLQGVALTLLITLLEDIALTEDEEHQLVTLTPAVERLSLAALQKGRKAPTLEPPDPQAEIARIYHESVALTEQTILPVRAQGLGQLKNLVASQPTLSDSLRRQILEIMLAQLGASDSYLYLTAISAISNLAVLGLEELVARRLATVIGGPPIGTDEEIFDRNLDISLRAAEAISQILELRGPLGEITLRQVVPTLLLSLRDNRRPSLLRASCLTILAKGCQVAPQCLLPYCEEIADAAITLLSLESRPFRRGVSVEPEAAVPAPRRTDAPRYEETPEPGSRDAKSQPSLRRSACLLFSILFADDMIDERLRQRAAIVLGYVTENDEDGLVRYQARMALDNV